MKVVLISFVAFIIFKILTSAPPRYYVRKKRVVWKGKCPVEGCGKPMRRVPGGVACKDAHIGAITVHQFAQIKRSPPKGK